MIYHVKQKGYLRENRAPNNKESQKSHYQI